MLIPRQTVPVLSVSTLDHGAFDLSTATPARWNNRVLLSRAFTARSVPIT